MANLYTNSWTSPGSFQEWAYGYGS